MQPVNIESKNLLARLLATENIYIRHKKVKTAFFNTVSRVLTFPIWKEMSDELYTMLAGHEVGHALWTARQALDEVARQIDPKHVNIAAAYINIIEDARIERLIKSMYPGLRRIFAIAYGDLLKRDFFGLHRGDPNYRCFIDKANLYFKVGEHVSLTFTDEEKALLQKIETTDTFEDVMRVTKQIYEWAKLRNEHPDPIELPSEVLDQLKEMIKNGQLQELDEEDSEHDLGSTIEIPMDGGDENEESGDGEEESGNGDKGNESSDGENGDESASGDGDNGGAEGEGNESGTGDDNAESKTAGKEDATSKDAKGKSKSDSKLTSKTKNGDGAGEKDGKKTGKDGQNKQQNKGNPTRKNNKKLKPVDPGPPPLPMTNQTFEENVKKLNDDRAAEIVYVSTPTPNLKNILVDYKKVHSELRTYFSSRATQAEAEFTAFRQQNNDKINYIFTQFEMKKQAARYLRTRVHKTGSLDMLRLHAYKYEDDLFRSVATVLDAKNHALLFIIDWSMSMQESMAGTIEQLINLTMFCRKAQIPFEVYSLTTGSRKAFNCKPGDMKYADNFRMRNYLSSRMNQKEFYEACVNLFALIPNGYFRGGPTPDNLIGCTPLDESIVTGIELIKEIRDRTKAEVVNAVFLTDGGANTVSEYLDDDGDTQYMHRSQRYVVEDRLTRKHYEFSDDYGSMTPRMLEIMRDRQNINAVGFYVTERFIDFFYNDDDKSTKQQEKEFNEHGCCVCTSWGFNELYILKGGKRLKVKPADFNMKHEPGSPKYMEEAMNKLSNFGKSTNKERLMLDRFVKMIA